MPRTDRDGRTVRLTVSRLLGRSVRDGELADALDLPISTYNRRKRRPDFPSFGDLRQIAGWLRVDEMVLQVDFGHLDVTDLNTELQQRYTAYRQAVDLITSMADAAPIGGTEYSSGRGARQGRPSPRYPAGPRQNPVSA